MTNWLNGDMEWNVYINLLKNTNKKKKNLLKSIIVKFWDNVGVHNNEHKLITLHGKKEVKESDDKSYLFTGYLSILFLLEYHVLTLL